MTSYDDYMGKITKILSAGDEGECEKKQSVERARLALEFHVEQMTKQGLVFRHTFEKTKYLGFSICLARLRGDAAPRDIVMVSRVDTDKCDASVGPGDELIEVDGELIVSPDARTSRTIQKAIYGGTKARRLTFVRGVQTHDERVAAVVPVSPRAAPPNYGIFEPPSVVAAAGSNNLPTAEDAERARASLSRHLETMDAAGAVVRHTFTDRTLGLSLALASVADNRGETTTREFLLVTRTDERCPLYPDRLKPGDELVAVEDSLVVLPNARSFSAIVDAIVAAPRPLSITFVEGIDRDERFQAQQAARGLIPIPPKICHSGESPLNPDDDDDDDTPIVFLERQRSNRSASTPPPKSKPMVKETLYLEKTRRRKSANNCSDDPGPVILADWPFVSWLVGGAEDFLCYVGCEGGGCSAPDSPISPYDLDEDQDGDVSPDLRPKSTGGRFFQRDNSLAESNISTDLNADFVDATTEPRQ